MPKIKEIARAKVNLTLNVGRAISEGRFKGYHPVDSLVVFADFGDELIFERSDNPKFEITGEFLHGLEFDESNLIRQALNKSEANPHSVTLTKNIPVSAGLGGGSANAAAVLRQFDAMKNVDDADIGADVPVCRLSQTASMTGIGETVRALPNLGQIPAVLINPRKAVSTGAIFKAFDSEPRAVKPEATQNYGSLLERALAGANDLQPIASALEPIIPDVLEVLKSSQNCLLARMSGSGATCFGLYDTQAEAQQAAKTIQNENPSWWVKSCVLGEAHE